MRIKTDTEALALIILVIILMILSGLLIYTNIKDQLVKEEFKDFTTFQIEFSQYLTEKLNSTYEVELERFLKYKTNEILNNVSSNTREIDNE